MEQNMKRNSLNRVSHGLVYPALIALMTGCAPGYQSGRPVSQPSAPPASVSIEPSVTTNSVGTQQVVTAVVRDKDGKTLHSALVEWTLARGPGAVGDIVEANQDPLNRALKLDNTYAITGVGYQGESSITLTSPFEGETHIIALVPDIADSSKHNAFAVRKWLDARWEFPADASNKAGTAHPMAVKVVKASNGEPLAGYDVHWKIASGPEAILQESGSAEAVTPTDTQGIAKVTLKQVNPTAGANKVDMTLVRPVLPGRACCPGVTGTLARGQMTKTWLVPALKLDKSCPASIDLGATGQFNFTVSNPSGVSADAVVLRDKLPQGFEAIAASGDAKATMGEIVWNLGSLAGGASKTLTLTAKPSAEGSFENKAQVASGEGVSAESACTLKVTKAELAVSKSCPAEALVGDKVEFPVTVRNTGSGDATNVMVSDLVPAGMSHESGQKEVVWNVGKLAAGETQSQSFAFTALAKGSVTNVAKVTGDRGLASQAQCATAITQAGLVLRKSGPEHRYAGRTATYDLLVRNPGDGAATNVVVSDAVPAGMSYAGSSPEGTYNDGTRTVSWALGTLPAGEERKLAVTFQTEKAGKPCNTATANADRDLTHAAEACTVVEGLAALLLEVTDSPDPVEIGSETTYTIAVTNQGSADATNVRIMGLLPPEATLVSSTGPTDGTRDGRVIRYAPIPVLPAGEKGVYTVTVQAVSAADARFAIQMEADQLTSPVNETESTRLY
jgi:uncharacterized repeat protein (TIGR01451 family)